MKRKTSQLEAGDNKPASAPLKKARTSEEAPRSPSARVTPRQSTPNAALSPRQRSASATPRQKPTSATSRQKPTTSSGSATSRQKTGSATHRQKPTAPSQNPVAAPSETSKNPKKRSKFTDDAIPEDPKTPAPVAKKPRVSKDDAAHKGNSKKSQPIRRSGMSHDLKRQYVENYSTRNINF
jgi:hypothetical protein